MSRTQIEMDGLLDRGSTTPMKSIPLAAQAVLQPGVTAQYGSCIGTFKFNGFAPAGVLIMGITPRYRIEIIDIYTRGNTTPALGDVIVVEKINTAGVAIVPPIARLAFAGTLIEVSRYVAAPAPGALNASFTIDPTLNESIRVSSAGVTGGATVTIVFVPIP